MDGRGRRRKKKPHGQGDPKLLQLISDLEARAKLLSIEERSAGIARERHAILVDFVCHQEFVLHLLQHGVPLTPAAALSRPPVSSYVSECLLAVTPAQLAEVQAWSSEADIKKLTQDLFQRLVVLLELLKRPQLEEDQAEGAAAADDGGGASGLSEDVGLQYQAELDVLINRAVTLTCLGLLFNCAPIVDSAANHQAVPEANEAVAAPDHWDKVVRRLDLTDMQLLHLALAAEEYARLSAGQAEAGKQLLRSSAATRLVEVAAEADKASQAAAAAATAAAATVAGRSGGSCSSSCSSMVTPASSSSQPSSSSQCISNPGGSASEELESSGAAAGAGGAAATAPAHGPAAGEAVAAEEAAAEEAAAVPPAIEADARQLGPVERPALELADEFQKHLDFRLLHMTVVSMFLLNTLSRTQIAQMIVASFPFQCVTAAIVEAAANLHKQQAEQPEQGPAAAAAAAAAPAPDAEIHCVRRRAAMQQQLQRWWSNMGAMPL